jgi:hypothetical protein
MKSTHYPKKKLILSPKDYMTEAHNNSRLEAMAGGLSLAHGNH